MGRDRAELHLRARPAIPKGVVTIIAAHTSMRSRNILTWGMPHHAVYLWTLPMFHCNGWCFPVDDGGERRHQCLPAQSRRRSRSSTRSANTGSPTIAARRSCYNTLINAPAELRDGLGHRVSCLVAGAAPPAVDDRGHGADRLRHHPCLRTDRNLWAGRGVREA